MNASPQRLWRWKSDFTTVNAEYRREYSSASNGRQLLSIEPTALLTNYYELQRFGSIYGLLRAV
jgi:hypothetical protein